MSLCIEEVCVARGGRLVLSQASLELRSGELLVVVGPNGAGKSTLLSVLSGDSAPTQGRVSLDGRPLASYSLESLARRRAVVGTPPRLAFQYTVRDVVAMGWLHGERFGARTVELAMGAVLDACELTPLQHRRYMTLSSGERQRAEYARASLQLWRPATEHATRWLLLDEPTANLDVAHGVVMLEALADRARAGDGVLAVLHDLDLTARFADRVALLSNGRIEAVGAAREVLTAERLSAVYRTPIHVEEHPALERLVVIG